MAKPYIRQNLVKYAFEYNPIIIIHSLDYYHSLDNIINVTGLLLEIKNNTASNNNKLTIIKIF
jgi:hypothetical protein